MSDSTLGLAQLLDREQIRDCLARLARGEDRRNAELIADSYWPDAVIDLGIFIGTYEQYVNWVVPGSPDIAATQHVLGQSLIDLHGETALVETQVLAYHRVGTPDGQCDSVIGGRYLDRMDHIGGTWRIARRTMIYDWYQEFGQSVDWAADGLMGLRLDTANYTGRAVQDPSEAFLGDGWSVDEVGGSAE
ncbi:MULTISPECIES: nuclear transport factor 2 family protein [unclassified Mycolicibacterium]|uniref:nuclear transport factor 2 family protein n=1 Tax=unclassified Mycolicibacterium TaxID=2636767 RepID=UPI0012DDB5F9|nr:MULTISPECIES: nuclear transport factor 2 family protein [unclassified Mycolicibacterium]MUL80499.1 nuclear transport factor 2 family protein [Mycolicibacterium sp. CBMA 329]MUL86266.1 nuclear transport factor 2 family protein [Mycolicibacterium sp. CBMA 331]MUM01072.1 nuclear transport factor 2 family protein [Mycolicibacterium sp. CBMA 334]MUM24966.1 nuclear transport factor 2 family protein [Mycolicibacterium sp. CBMA 295]MUM36562.1 nuclear transport factor 2 family protein [Mycolicibacte